MLIPPKYILSPKISQFLQSIEGSKQVIDSINIPPEMEQNIRRQSTLKSSLFSARIEGNPLTLEEIRINPSRSQKKQEVFNILKALNWVYQRRSRDITASDMLNLHKMVMENLIEKQDLGRFRTDVSAIFNTAGIAIYLPPRPNQIIPLINRLIKFVNNPKGQFIPILACFAHYTFEKIHPFLDGNGRVGRLILQLLMSKNGYDMKGLLSIEEYLDNHRGEYYSVLNEPEKDVTDYLEFMLEAIAETAAKAKQLVLEKEKVEVEDLLLPRRAEILNTIRDHNLVSFNTLKRRFLGVNERTLRYDLKKLQDQGLIKKRGATKGVFYEPIKNSTTSPSFIT